MPIAVNCVRSSLVHPSKLQLDQLLLIKDFQLRWRCNVRLRCRYEYSVAALAEYGRQRIRDPKVPRGLSENPRFLQSTLEVVRDEEDK